jgi:hypothetical protein
MPSTYNYFHIKWRLPIKEIRRPGANFYFGGPFFPKDWERRVKTFFQILKKGKKLSGRTGVKLRFKIFFPHKFLLQHGSDR